ncbi:MAG: nucleotidyl transferase AbiEii/AbiGii toxin family protein [Acidobacteria bacterium]|nr:nucleotidyl transferase AbiEii/AbiGii toxin family protein [Acidobacteriota bacterium]
MTAPTTKPELLQLPEPARSVFRKIQKALDTHISAHTPNQEGYQLGGGTVLAARWGHRNSEDIDLTCHPDTETAHFPTRLEMALKEAGGKAEYWGEWSRVDFTHSHLDVVKKELNPRAGHHTAIIDGQPVTVLSNVQILTGKLQNRALDPPVRDVYDIAVCGIEDPQSLEGAINGIYAATLDSTILGWNMNRNSHAESTGELINDVPARLQPVKERPAEYAIQAAENALYQLVTISAERGVIHVRTKTATAERTRPYETAAELERGFEATGMNNFLRANGRNSREIRESAHRAVRQGVTRILVELRPELPPRRQQPLPTIRGETSAGKTQAPKHTTVEIPPPAPRPAANAAAAAREREKRNRTEGQSR